VPLAVAREAEEDLLDREVEARQLDALDADGPAREVAHVVVAVDGQGEAQLHRVAQIIGMRLLRRERMNGLKHEGTKATRTHEGRARSAL
jgi:hypothetical protein